MRRRADDTFETAPETREGEALCAEFEGRTVWIVDRILSTRAERAKAQGAVIKLARLHGSALPRCRRIKAERAALA
jgi:hypothetical protein